MLDFILNLDTELFLFLNGINSPFWDEVMHCVSHKYFWIPLYMFLVYLLYKNYDLKQALILTLLIIITFALCNTISVELFKNVFQRLRPCHNPDIMDQVHLVNNHCGGQWGFVSSHASNVFGLASITSIFLSKKIKYFGILIFIWAAIVSYSRIYLGVHYPLDLLGGSILGATLGILVFTTAKILGLQLHSK